MIHFTRKRIVLGVLAVLALAAVLVGVLWHSPAKPLRHRHHVTAVHKPSVATPTSPPPVAAAPAPPVVQAPPPPPPPPPTGFSSSDLSNVPGVPQSFAACVAFRESTNGQGSSNIYGIIPASGYNVAGLSLAQQKQVFAQLYAANGTSPWSPYDGC